MTNRPHSPVILCHASIGSHTRLQDWEQAMADYDGQVEEIFLDDPVTIKRYKEEAWISCALALCMDAGRAVVVTREEIVDADMHITHRLE